MNESDWFPQYFNKENRERYASASSPSPRLLFDQWAHSCVGRKWEIRRPLTTSSNDRNYNWIEVFLASYKPSDQSTADSHTPSFMRLLASRRSGKFSIQKYNDQGELLPEEVLDLSPDCVRPSLASWKNRSREIISSVFSPSEEEMAKNDFETSSIQDEIHSSVTFSVSLSVPLSDEPLGLRFDVNKDNNIELKFISPSSIASRAMALLPGDILEKCSSINALWKNSPSAFVVEENDCTVCQNQNERIVAAYVKSHKDFPHISPFVKMTFRRTLTNLVSFHMSTGKNNTKSSADCSLNIENSILQNSYEALKSLLLLKVRFNNQSVSDLESDDISSQLETVLNCYKWLLQAEHIKSMLSSGKECRKDEESLHTLDQICQHVKLGSNLVLELSRIFALHKPPNSACWFVNKFIERHSWLSREHKALLIWLDATEKMCSLCSNPRNESYYEVHEMIETLEQATCVDRSNFVSLAAKFDSTKKLMDSLARKVSICKVYVERLERLIEQFIIIPPTPFHEIVSPSVNSSPSSASACSIIDPVLQSLHELHREMSSKPDLSNVKDFVKVPHLLAARKWATKALHAHNNGTLLRERFSFYQDLIETANKYENDWAQAQILSLISDQWKKIPELQVMLDFTAMVGDGPERQKKATIIEAEEYLSKMLLQNIGVVTSPMLKKSLSILSRFPVLCILEEKILVWLDVMQLTELMESDNKMNLDELLELLKVSSHIHDGKSPQRWAKIRDLTPNAIADIEVRKFSTTFDKAVSFFQETAKRWAAEAEQWKASARQFLRRPLNTSAEHVRIMQLLTTYNNLHVCINEEYSLLSQQVRTFHTNEENSDDNNVTKEKSAAHKLRISTGQDYTDVNSCGSKYDHGEIRENCTEINNRSSCDSVRCASNGKLSANGDPNQSTTCEDVDYGCDSDLFSSCTEDNEDHEKDFTSESFVVENRNIVLDCLLKRKALSDDSVCSSKREKTSQLFSLQESDFKLFHRSKTRRQLTKCFTSGVHELGLQESLHLCQEFCCFLAWRLERIVYKKFPWNMSSDDGEDKGNYNDVLLRITRNLKSNRTLCASVLVGDTDLSSLVELSPKELASRHILKQREEGAKQAEKQRVVDASDAQFGMVGLLNQARSTFILAAANKTKDVFLDQIGDHTSQRNTSETFKSDLSMGGFIDKINPGKSTIDKMKSDKQSGLNVSYLKQPLTSDTLMSRASELLRMEGPDEREYNPLLNIQLPDLETDVGGMKQGFGDEQYEEEEFLSEPENSDDDELDSVTPSDAYEEIGHQCISTEAPAAHFQEMQTPTTGGGQSQIKPKGGGTLFSFILQVKVITNFKASLFMDINQEFLIKIQELLPYSMREKRTCSFGRFRDFFNEKQKDKHHDIVFCRLSFSYTEIVNQDQYKVFRRAYEEKERVAIFEIPGDTPRQHVCVYLLVPRLLKLMLKENKLSGVNKEKIESTHLMLIIAKSERA